ncbi:MAG: glycosyltransferase family 39 protein [Candidatus Omnitrophica bacterium]|nr:glycosyltransferase family 39 protein [Candidatus Omnitrophota bacterium]
MNRLAERPLLSISLLAALCLYLFCFRLGSFALTDPDETFYAQTAKEMVERGEWSTPFLYGKPQFEKPILIYWLIEAAFKAFGVNEAAARLPSAVFALLGVIALYLLGARLFNRRVGLFSALALATCVEYIILSRAVITDMVLAVLMLFGALFFFYAYPDGKKHFYYLSAAAFGLAVLTKGPVALVLPAFIFLAYFACVRDWQFFRKVPLIGMALTFLAVSAPWYIVIWKLHGMEFVSAFLGFQNVTRFLVSEHKIGSQWYYNIPIVFGGFFPWSAFLPFGFWHVGKKVFAKDGADRKSSLFVFLWFMAIFLFFSVSSTKLPTYIFPSFMSLALIVGVLWDDLLKDATSVALARGVRWSHHLLMAVVAGGGIGIFIFLKRRYPLLLDDVLIPALFLIFGFILSAVELGRRRFNAAFALIVYAVALFLYPFGVLALPALEPYETSKDIARKLATMMKPGERAGAEKDYVAGVTFYTGRFAEDVDRHHLLVRFLDSGERVWVVLKEKNHRQLYELDHKPYYTKPSYVVYKYGKKCLVTNKVPEDGRYLRKRDRTSY